MKILLCGLMGLLMLTSNFTDSTSLARNNNNLSDIGITFDSSNEVVKPDKKPSKSVVENKSDEKSNKKNSLPFLGEIVNSILFSLTGVTIIVSVFIFISLKTVLKNWNRKEKKSE